MEHKTVLNRQKRVPRLTLKMRLALLLFVIAVPLTCMILWFLSMIHNYSESYDEIMENLKVANEYNRAFKEDMEYSMYRVMIALIDTDDFKNGDIREGTSDYATIVKNPFGMIEEARQDFSNAISNRPGSTSDIKIRGILSCLDSLETAVERMISNSKKPGTYDENTSIWENDIQGLCSMIQDYINQYIYYEILRMEALQRELQENTRQTMVGLMATSGGVLILGLLFSAMITRSVTGPIQDLKETAERLGHGELEARARMGSLEEINVLARTFNRMSDEISDLMEKTKQEQQNLWRAELKLRQEQINPHFLYNTLDSIVWMAEGGNNQQVVEMTKDLSDFFRTVLSEGQDFITIAEEEAHILSYLKIQKIRYDDILDYEISIEPAIKDRVVLKMILQPIVENALYHGIKNKRGGGKLVVRGYEDRNGIVFEVEDNGIGMDKETLERLRRKLTEQSSEKEEKRGGFGLKNVAQRIRMYYGGESDLTIESEKQVGTCIKVYLGHAREDRSKKNVSFS